MFYDPNFSNILSQFTKIKDNKLIKIVPNNIEDYLTPASLAYWIFDDGYKREAKDVGLYLCTESFTLDEIITLNNALYSKFNLYATIQKRVKPGHYHISF